LWTEDVNCGKIEGCKYKIGGLRTNMKLVPKIQGPNYKSVKELNYDLILGNGESKNDEYGKLGVTG
jgi:ABC-type Fe3+-hydroxamate transport system substrate-binding protein